MKIKRILIVLFLLSIGNFCSGMSIVENGQPKAKIIIGENVPYMVEFAANEFQKYIEKITGAKIPIQRKKISIEETNYIFIGESSYTKELGLSTKGLTYDGFKIISRNNWLALFGRDYKGKPISGIRHPWTLNVSYNPRLKINRMGETGTLFAVYRFLEDYCGVRWYMPGELGEVVPKKKNIKIKNINYQKSPDFEYRFLSACNFPEDDDCALWYRRAGFGAPFPVQINHSFYMMRKYFKTHPEYFALVDGKRDFNITCMGSGNLCLSEPGVLKQFVRDINEYFDKHPEQYIFPVMPNDSFTRICECPRCQKQIDNSMGPDGKFSNYVWSFVNKVAKEVYKTHPDKFIGCCAYGAYRKPPTNIKKFSPNVVVMICKVRRNYWNKKYKETIKKTIEEWRKKVKNIYVWEYYNWLATTPYLRGSPVFYPHIISEDLKYLKGISKGEFIEAESWRGSEPRKMHFLGLTHLNLYLTAKLLWDANLDIDKVLEDYYEKFYGPAKEEMKSFWTTAENIWMKNTPHTPTEIYRSLYTEEAVNKLLFYLRRAISKTPEDSLYRKRIELILSEFLPVKKRIKNTRVMKPPSYTCIYTNRPPKIDGVLKDDCWEKSVPIDFVGETGEEVKYKTDAYLTWDEKNLYLAFINYEPKISNLKALCTERDGISPPYIWEDDSIEIFIDPHRLSEKSYYQFVINTIGTIWDGYRGSSKFGKKPYKWNSNIKAKTKIEKDRWVLEVAIPLKDIGVKNSPEGRTFTLNLYRNRYCDEGATYSCWSPTLIHNHHTPKRFGSITFEKRK